MVFEAVVIELLNKFLKQYIENLDTSQLKIGIWGGDVVLNDLKINSSIFDDWNLPVKVKWGKLGKLALKIPWKNLYASQVVVDIEEFLILLTPCNEFKYDAVKEEKLLNDRKQAKLKAVEDGRKREIEVDSAKQSDGFIEKLLTQITKNIQIIIKNIHIRYEDKSTNPKFPYSVGATISNLSATTTAKDPSVPSRSTIECENFNLICKVVHLEGLAIYWNPCSELFSESGNLNLANALLETIPKNDYKPNNYFYVFGPLSAVAILKLNPKPENDGSNFTIPKVSVNVHLKEIELAITHNQFRDVLLFAQNFHRLSAAAKFRKYRPVGICVLGHAKEWWHFAYNCIVEDIRRRKHEWSWENIKEHRRLCKKYSELYAAKLSSRKLSLAAVEELAALEKKLNVFNILLLREQAYVHVERSSIERDSRSTKGGWFSGWFGTTTKETPAESDLVKKIESVMTPQEKEKLYKAIGYDESAPVPNFPPDFVEFKFSFNLDEIKATILDDESIPVLPITILSVKRVTMGFEQRPVAFAFRFEMSVGKLNVLGKKSSTDEDIPELVTSNCGNSESLVEIVYETKPLIGFCDQRIQVRAQPLRIVYHAETINRIRNVFCTGRNEDISRIVSVTSASLPAFRRITAIGLQYAIEKKTIVEVKVNIMPSYLIIPHGGSYKENKEMLVIMFGKLNIETEESDQKDVSVKKLYLEGTSEQEIFSTVLLASYTNFKCTLTGMQVLLQLENEDWVCASGIQGRSPLRFLESTDLVVMIKKSLVTDDPRIPKMICECKLPSLDFNFSEERFIAFAALLCSIPFKTEEGDTFLKKETSTSAWSLQSIGTQLENKLGPFQKDRSDQREVDYVQGIDLVIRFEMNELLISVLKSKDLTTTNEIKKKNFNDEDKFLTLRVVMLEAEVTRKTFETVNLLKLRGIELNQFHKHNILPFVTTKGLLHDCYLFVVEFTNVSVLTPNFRNEKGAVVNRLTLNVTPLNVILNKEALLAQLAFFARVQTRLDNVKRNCKEIRMATAGKSKDIFWESSAEVEVDRKIISKGKKFRRKLPKKEIVSFFLDAAIEEVNVTVEFEGQGLTEFSIKGGSVEISVRKSFTNLDFSLKEILLSDLNPQTIHKKVIESVENKTLSARVTMFNSEYFGTDNSVDVSVEAEIGGVRCSFLNLFFSRVLAFLSAFHVQVQTLKESATVAAQKAKQNVIKAYKNASRICLNVKINAPILIIPKKSSSLEVLVVDLGVLTVRNYISELNYATEGDFTDKPIIDSMKFHLQNLKFSRCVLGNDMVTFGSEKTFLIPVTFELTIKRNLSPAWLKVIPEFEVLAKLAAVYVTLTHDDLCNIAIIIKNNTDERLHAPIVKDDSERPTIRTKKVKEQDHLQQPETGDTVLDEGGNDHGSIKPPEDQNIYTVVKFAFYMDSFVIDALVTSDKKANNRIENETYGLARFVLETISIKGRKFSNGSMNTSMLLVSCMLIDTRPGKEGRLTRLMERTDVNINDQDADPNSINSMIEVVYKTKEFDAFVDMRVYKFTLILSMDFLHKLKEFFTIKNADMPSEMESREISKTIKPNYGNKSKVSKNEISGSRPHTFTVDLRLEKPDIIIVENMDSIDTDALIFHTEILMKYRFAGTRQVISATLSDIELYSCCFNPAKRRQTLSQVIRPFTVSIAGSTPIDQGLHVDVCLTELVVTVNPSTVELISKCYETLLAKSVVSESQSTENDFSDLWETQSFHADDFWFLKAEQGEDALTAMSESFSQNFAERKSYEEICLVAVPSVVILVEGLIGKTATPLLLWRMGYQMQSYNWSTKLSISSSLTLQLDYYNKTGTSWEPLIEPIEIQEDKEKKIKHSYTPWDVNLSVICGEEGYLDAVEPPKVSVSISCTEILPVTISKSGLEVLKNALEIYTSAVNKRTLKKGFDLPPFIVKNETGLVVELLLKESSFQVCKALSDQYKIVKLESDSEVELQMKSAKISAATNFCASDKKKEIRLLVQFPIAKPVVFELPLNLASKRYFPIPLRQMNVDEIWGLVSDASLKDNTTFLILRSIVKIINYFLEPIAIHSLSESGNEVEYVGTVEGNSSYSLPFHAVYNSDKKLFFSVKGYFLSSHPFSWETLKKNRTTSLLLQCTSKTPETNDPFFIQVVGETEDIYFGNTSRRSSASYTIHLQPTVQIFNSLPVNLIICFQGCAKEKYLPPGNNLQITNAEPGNSSLTLRISNYLEKEWSLKETIAENPPEFFIWRFISYSGLTPETLNLGVHCTFTRKTAVYTIYCPYFMVNKTDHLLSYRFDGSHAVFYHPKDFRLPVMFSPSYRKFFSKKSAYLKVNYSDWSEKFPVDVAGSGGTVECEDASTNIIYKVSITITLTYNSLTKIVTFTPYYVFINETNYKLECRECDFPNDSWLEISPDTGTPFWPKSRAKSRTIEIRPRGSQAITPPFHYSNTDTCLLRLNHKCGGIFVNVQATQSGTYVTFHSYEPGQAPVLIINHSAKIIKISELESKYEIVLKPFKKIMHAWTLPTGKRRLTVMNPKHFKDEIFLDQDTEGQVCTSKGEFVRYVTFLDGSQRVLLFTDDLGLSSSITNFLKLSYSGIELICDIQGIGISVVNNLTCTEILYMTLISSGITWEMKKPGKNRFKRMKQDDIYKIEEAYTRYKNESEIKEDAISEINVTEKIKVNFETMQMLSPQTRDLKRIYEPGVWLAYRLMEDQIMINLRVNKIQIDNQLNDCIFPVILSPVPPPKSVAALYQASKPFFELSIVKKAADRSTVEQYKYFEILVQEFQVKIDAGFLHQFWQFLSPQKFSYEEEKIRFLKDLEAMERPLISHVEVVSSSEQKNFYEFLHFSPLKVHFSFSLAGKIESSSLPPSLGVMIQSVGVTLADVHDVIFRLSYFERKCIFLTRSQLQSEVISHYYGQTLRQAYVLLLGLDVIGNPFGLIVGIGEGVEAFFYEPFQGMVHGPSEFATGVAIGCKNLFGRTVGSTAGTLGKLTETLGKGLAVLSLDREYQLQRMEHQNRQENIQASMARGGRGLVMGVFEGVTGVVKKPLEGAKEEGVGGFFKGMGKGMMGLVTRPVTGVVDFASTSFNAVRRATGPHFENTRLRPPRFFRDDQLLQPYNLYEALGNGIFHGICRRKYCGTDKYEHHVVLKNGEIALFTNKRMILAEQNDFFGTWQEHMAITWISMPERPHCHSKGIAITLPEKGKASKGKYDVKVLLISDQEVKEDVCKKMIELYNLEREAKA